MVFRLKFIDENFSFRIKKKIGKVKNFKSAIQIYNLQINSVNIIRFILDFIVYFVWSKIHYGGIPYHFDHTGIFKNICLFFFKITIVSMIYLSICVTYKIVNYTGEKKSQMNMWNTVSLQNIASEK